MSQRLAVIARSRCFGAVILPGALLCGLVGCGNPGGPQPPSLLLPRPATDLQGGRVGDRVSLTWTMPRLSTDEVPLKGRQIAMLCRALAGGPCKPVGEIFTPPGGAARFAEVLPGALRQGAPRLLGYQVKLLNHKGESAGGSNVVYSAAGEAPPAMQAVSAENTKPGIRLNWQAPARGWVEVPGARLLVRLDRERLPEKGVGAEVSRGGVQQPAEQRLESVERAPAEGGAEWLPDHTLDAEAARDRTYRYTVRLVEQLRLDGHAMELSGEPARTAAVEARDVFPPAVPMGLAAVANAEERTIDLSWTFVEDATGYVVYRRVAGGSGPAERVSGKQPLAAPAWSDAHAVAGVRYSYAVAAVDADGNQSELSAEVSETLPAQEP